MNFKNKGLFIISLDFELMWGVFDKKSIKNYGDNILGARKVLFKIVDLMNKYDVKGTFATVGFLFASNKRELLDFTPDYKPQYIVKKLSPYKSYFNLLKDSEEIDKFHYANSLINKLKKYKNHEIASHTFSHFYCLEKGQNKDSFFHDMNAAKKIMYKNGIKLESLVFPRNQYNKNYIKILQKLGVTSFRGNEDIWFKNGKSNFIKRIFRFLDSYINISGHNNYSLNNLGVIKPLNLKASRFLRPYSKNLFFLENFKLKRIKNDMKNAAKNKKIYHLWFHPHNYGVNQKQNLDQFNELLSYYNYLKNKYDFKSCTMSELTKELI